MSFSDETKTPVTNSESEVRRAIEDRLFPSERPATLSVNRNNFVAEQDYTLIIQAFESNSSDWEEDDYALATHYKDVYSTKQFSKRAQDQLNYYPGLHQASKAAKDDPAYTAAKNNADNRLRFLDSAMTSPDGFGSALRSRQQDFNYAKVFGSDQSAKDKARELGKIATECVPCFKRLLDVDGLVPDGDLLEVHLLNAKIRLDFLKHMRRLFDNPGLYIDICELLRLLSRLCPTDLFAMSMMLTQYLAKLNLEIKFNLDFIIGLVGSILSPFLDAIGQWLDKWIQLILEPIICVVDHINETVLLAQSAKIPFSQSSAKVDYDLGVSSSAGSANSSFSGSSGYSDGQVWTEGEAARFDTPDNKKYDNPVPTLPRDEALLSAQEIPETYDPSFSESEREERDKRFDALRKDSQSKSLSGQRNFVADKTDGTRWSRDNTPASEKNTASYNFDKSVRPPEKVKPVSSADKYWDPAPLVSSIVQVRNIMQSGIAYIQDWFRYITQMIYDLLGIEIGWMSKKTGTTSIKTNIIQLLKIIKAIINAINKNGLRCGADTNLDPAQVKYIVEGELNSFTDYEFSVQESGDISVLTPGQTSAAGSSNKSPDVSSQRPEETVDSSVGPIAVDAGEQQSSQLSSIIVKSCFNATDAQDIENVTKWIAYFERRLANEAS